MLLLEVMPFFIPIGGRITFPSPKLHLENHRFIPTLGKREYLHLPVFPMVEFKYIIIRVSKANFEGNITISSYFLVVSK